ncbi:hypothetical protein Taro_009233 [Colocasia esculenta]|uniref:Uncharacterized protein n=1 Tax=Colocasia esculenta TaxID=4460 RepID=A0A843U4D6_COLES|nr:hypothetical protein [Colocasia esculenta]
MEGRKKVHLSSSRTVENASATCVATSRTRPVRASRQRLHRDWSPRRGINLFSCHKDRVLDWLPQAKKEEEEIEIAERRNRGGTEERPINPP